MSVDSNSLYVDTSNNITLVSTDLNNELQLLFFYVIMIFSSMILGCIFSYVVFLRYICVLREIFTESHSITHSIKSVTV